MLFQTLSTILGCLLTVRCRDIGKPFRSVPTITGSLVNLGKIDISFHFNPKDPAQKVESSPHHSFSVSKSEPIYEEPCPCTGFRSFNNPSEILGKMLTNGDMFSFNKETTTSTLCCNSHENVHEDVVTFEFGPKGVMPLNPLSNLPKLPFIFENILGNRQPVPVLTPSGKPKAVEIFLLPKKGIEHTRFLPMTKEAIKNDNIKIVGDKHYKNDYKPLKFRPSVPISLQSSVKKDLTAQQNNETKNQVEEIKIQKEEIAVTTPEGDGNTI